LEQKNLAHGSLRPENIMITKNLEVKIVDFGFGKSDKEELQPRDYCYLAPELLHDRKQAKSIKTDVWAAGVIFYQMLTGYCPFLETTNEKFRELQISKGLYLPLDIFGDADIDPAYINLFEHAFIEDPKKRATPTQLKELLGVSLHATCQSSLQMRRIKVVMLGDFGVGKSTLLGKMAHS